MRYLKIDTREHCIEAQGCVVDMSVLMLEAIGAMYDGLKSSGNSPGAEFFKQAITLGIAHTDSPVFSDSVPSRGDAVLVDIDEIKRMFGHGK